MTEVPASTKVHRTRVKNVETDRLQRRQAYLIENLAVDRVADYLGDSSPRHEFKQRVWELWAIENELDRRDQTTRTRTSAPVQAPATRDPQPQATGQ